MNRSVLILATLICFFGVFGFENPKNTTWLVFTCPDHHTQWWAKRTYKKLCKQETIRTGNNRIFLSLVNNYSFLNRRMFMPPKLPSPHVL